MKDPNKLIRLRAEPKKPSTTPKWTTETMDLSIYSIVTGFDIEQEIIDGHRHAGLTRADIKDAEVTANGSCGCYYRCDCGGQLQIEYNVRETQAVLDARMLRYDQRKINYDEWYANNKDTVIKEIARRTKIKNDKNMKAIVKKALTSAAQLDKDIKKAEALLKKHGVK